MRQCVRIDNTKGQLMACSGGWRKAARRLGAALVGVGIVACLPQARAAQPSLPSLALAAGYGDGVHAYFAGDYIRAYEDLTQVIEAGTRDPRAYYFRGLAALRQGRGDEAEADFTTGAERESESLGNWPVARSLERVQGPDRLRLERYRVRARVVLLQRQREAERLRYSQIEEAQPEVLRRRRPVTPRLEDGEDEGNVFEEKEEGGAEGEGESADEVEAEAMPAGDDGAVDGEPAGEESDDPFGEAATDSGRAEQGEELAAEREDGEIQREQQAEMSAAEGEDETFQAEAQAEENAAAGEQ